MSRTLQPGPGTLSGRRRNREQQRRICQGDHLVKHFRIEADLSIPCAKPTTGILRIELDRALQYLQGEPAVGAVSMKCRACSQRHQESARCRCFRQSGRAYIEVSQRTDFVQFFGQVDPIHGGNAPFTLSHTVRCLAAGRSIRGLRSLRPRPSPVPFPIR